jgi:glycosyltransferase involved in cell wall biosynthesis
VTTAQRPDRLAPGRPGAGSSYRVGLDARYLKRPGVGISRYVEDAVRDLLESGAHVTLLTDDDQHAGALRSAFPSAWTVALPGRSGFLWEQRQLRRHLDLAGYDAYVAPANYGLPLAYRGSTALILVVHDLIPLRLGHVYLPRRPLWAVKYLLSTAISAARADQVIAPSHATARDITRLLRRRNVAVAYPPIPWPGNGIPNAGNAALPASLIDPASRNVKPYFIYNGGADIRKNVPTLLRAFGKIRHVLPDLELVMIGPGHEYYNHLVQRMGLGDHVHILGYVDEITKSAILDSAVALVYPSRMEGFGLPILEAMAAGIPAVSGTGGSLREVGGQAVTYVPAISAESLAAAMVSVTREGVREEARSAGASQLRLLMNRRRESTLAGIVEATIDRRLPKKESTVMHADGRCGSCA